MNFTSIEEALKNKLGDIEPIKGFRVMEWLRGVRDASYELFINGPEAYQREMKEAGDRIDAMMEKRKRREHEYA